MIIGTPKEIKNNLLSLAMDENKQITICFAKDSDDDSVPDKCEMGPEGSDPYYESPHNQGKPVYLDPNIISMVSPQTGNYINVASEYSIIKEFNMDTGMRQGLPAATYEFFNILTERGADNIITIYLPMGVLIKKCYVYGPTFDSEIEQWLENIDDVLIEGSQIIFYSPPAWAETTINYLFIALLIEDLRNYGYTSAHEITNETIPTETYSFDSPEIINETKTQCQGST